MQQLTRLPIKGTCSVIQLYIAQYCEEPLTNDKTYHGQPTILVSVALNTITHVMIH